MAAGVYVIRNSCSNRVYVGSAQDVSKRWYKHRKDLRAGTHHSRPLQAAWDEIGEAEFSFELVLTVTDVDDLLFYEQCTMDRLHAGPTQGGYNVSNKARAARGYKHSRKRSVATDTAPGPFASLVPLRSIGVHVFDKCGNLVATACDATFADIVVFVVHREYSYPIPIDSQFHASTTPEELLEALSRCSPVSPT